MPTHLSTPPSRKFYSCPICDSRRLRYSFSHAGHRVVRCSDCQLMFLNPQPGEAALRPANFSSGGEAGREQARARLAEMQRYRGVAGGRLLEVGCGEGDFLAAAEAAGFEVTGVEALPEQALPEESFDVCVLSDVIERVRDPLQLLRAAHRLLKPDGTLVVATRSLDSLPARFRRQSGNELTAEALTYFDRRTIQTALLRNGFDELVVEARSEQPGVVFARRTRVPERRKLSIIMPAFNEAADFEEVVAAVLAKTLPDLDLELIIVESNSTDGTRELALKYRDHPRVTLILEDQPRGKGHAVRTGLQAATGDFILIQDADLEYDLDDYDALLEPLVEGREAFVLGSRHSGSVWKMRQFAGQAGLSAFLNLGHCFFTTLVNVLFGQRLKDPFTMFKVFRRDCLFGLTFECNRFDFDYELLVKLIRKGYRPLELPVNYRSRSFKEGKKVTMISDPLSWLRALIRLRLAKIDPLAEVERGHRLKAAAALVPPAPALAAAAAILCH